MKQQNLKRLAHHFMNHALRVQPDSRIWIDYAGKNAEPLMLACAEEALKIGAHIRKNNVGALAIKRLMGSASASALESRMEHDMADIKKTQFHLNIRDDADQAHVAPDVLAAFEHARKDVVAWRSKHVQWLGVRAPSHDFAQICGMSQEKFDRWYFKVNMKNYAPVETLDQPLVDRLKDTKIIRIKGRDTALEMQHDPDVDAVACFGRRNIPDLEVYTAPVKTSVQGHIRFGRSRYNGQSFEFIRLEVKDGYVKHAEAEDGAHRKILNTILDADEGARYFGEFALGLNPFITQSSGVILYDEKIRQSIHMALGHALSKADNGNRSVHHWDLVHQQDPRHGGGEIWFDDKLIRKDGLFLPEDLKPLNPEPLTDFLAKTSRSGATHFSKPAP